LHVSGGMHFSAQEYKPKGHLGLVARWQRRNGTTTMASAVFGPRIWGGRVI
jgi:hypothetical protein